jgi:hypothetical protein
MPRSTGSPSADAQDDFTRARRRGQLARLLAFVRREPDLNVILPYDEVVQALGRVGKRDLGLHTIRLDSIVGTVDRRRRDFDRSFRPASGQLRSRWERVAEARRRGVPLPPIDVYRIGEAHFVRDGHHRVSVALEQGDDVIEAHVSEILTRVGLDRSVRLSDLQLKRHERIFHDRVPLPPEARARIRLSDPWDYGALAEGAEAWGYRVTQHDRSFLDRTTLARRWFEEDYLPALELLREAELLERYATETDAYLELTGKRERLPQTDERNEDAIERVRQSASSGPRLPRPPLVRRQAAE